MKFSILFLSLCCLAGSAQASDWSNASYELAKPHTLAVSVAPDPVYQQIFQSVSKDKLETLLKQTTGGIPVTVGAETFSITDRYLPASKAKFRAFWTQYFQALGIPVKELSFPSRNHTGETTGHNLEAVLPGKSKDSVVIIVHYDSIGPRGRESENPGVDDDMTGMVTLMETARILAEHKNSLQNTVRFVAADYEELGELEGARRYATYLKELAQGNFKILAAVDNEQSGWNCMTEGYCHVAKTPVDIFSCSGDGHGYDSKALGDSLAQVAATYSTLSVVRGCMGENSDHYAMWEIGVPSVVFSEHSPASNPHFDANGGDTFDKIDKDYFFHIAQIGVTFAVSLAGLDH